MNPLGGVNCPWIRRSMTAVDLLRNLTAVVKGSYTPCLSVSAWGRA